MNSKTCPHPPLPIGLLLAFALSSCGADQAAAGPVMSTLEADSADVVGGGDVAPSPGDAAADAGEALGDAGGFEDTAGAVDSGSDVGGIDDVAADGFAPDLARLDVLLDDTSPSDLPVSDASAPDTPAPDTSQPDLVALDTPAPDAPDSDAAQTDGAQGETTAGDGLGADAASVDVASSDAGRTCAHLGCPCTAKSDCDSGNCAKPEGASSGPGRCATACLLATDPDAACADEDLCTSDACDPKKGCTHTKSAKACDDGNACTVDGCDTKSGCTHSPSAGPCDDGNACTEGDGCAKGSCMAGPAAECDDGNACTKDRCDAGKGCLHDPVEGACDDGDACTKGGACNKGQCEAAGKVSCEDGDPCTDDSCDKPAGCVHRANTRACEDGNKCTEGDNCDGGQCKPGVAASCDDGNPCTEVHCDLAIGCTATALDLLCDDGDACTTIDKCQGGQCVPGPPKSCEDGNPCTTDACLGGHCDYTANTASCDDGNPCTVGDTCSVGACEAGKQAEKCDDGNPCTDDYCAPGNEDKGPGGCVHQANAATCTDDDECSSGDRCTQGACKPTGGVKCDDGNPCTDDSCHRGADGKPGGCVHALREGSCDDGNKCTGTGAEPDTCAGGHCTAGAKVPCDDGNACTLHDCKPASGCIQSPIPGECTDGDVCTAGDSCKKGQCAAGPPKNCDDGSVCTSDDCDAKLGCLHAFNHAPCEDGNKCTAADSCADGVCEPGKPLVCTDHDTCTSDTCDGTKGCVHVPKPHVVNPPCDGHVVGKACLRALSGSRSFTQGEAVCKARGGHLASLHSGHENQIALAEAMARCGTGLAWIGLTDAAKEGAYAWTDGSKIDYTNWNKGEPNNYHNEDQVHMLDGGKWNDLRGSARLNCVICRRGVPIACDDGNPCTSGEVCTGGGQCTPAFKDCNDHNACTVDLCTQDKGCQYTALEDGAACGSGVCGKGQCTIGVQARPARSCQEIANVAALKPPNGVYWLDPDGGGKSSPFRTFCAFNPGVGWTLAMKLSGASKTFRYDRSYWTNAAGYHTKSVNFDTSEAKLPPFWTMPIKQVLLSMKLGPGYTWLLVPKTASSLRTVFAGGSNQATHLGRAAWLGLLGGASLQPHCNREGFNVGSRAAQVRIGIIGNNENNCGTPDSRLGFGGRGYNCGQDDNNTVGNTAACNGHGGRRNIKAFGYIFIR